MQAERERLDKLLVERGLAESRSRAQGAIMAGTVYVDGEQVDKAGTRVSRDASLEVRGAGPRYVSRGGQKLEHALRSFNLDVTGLRVLDVGASTGGFTDCLLQHGAEGVTALDVGHGQLAWKLRQDPRVQVLEGVNARYLSPDDLDGPFDLITMDVAFISVTKILPALMPLLGPGGRLIMLVKPQFEAGPTDVGRGGVVREEKVHQRVLQEVTAAAEALGLAIAGLTPSPITGGAGNVEFLCLAMRQQGDGGSSAVPDRQERDRMIDGAVAAGRTVAGDDHNP